MPDEPRSVRKLKLFLSHSSADKKAVRILYDRLQGDGFEPWIDDENLLPGQNWRLVTQKAVRNSDIVLICLSTSSVKRPGYVHKEMSMALDLAEQQPEGTIFVIPLRLDDCEVPERVLDLHLLYVDLFEERGYEKLKKALFLKAGELETDVSVLPEAVIKPVPPETVPAAAAEPASAPVENNHPGHSAPPVVPTPEAPPNVVEREKEEEKKKDGPAIKYQAIIVAVITGVVALTGAYWQFVYKPQNSTLRYSGRVLDADTRKAIGGASVIVEGDGVPLNYPADSNGIFYMELKTGKDTVRIRVSADGYVPSDRIVSLSRTGVEEFPLSAMTKSPPGTPAGTVTPTPSLSPSNSPSSTPHEKDPGGGSKNAGPSAPPGKTPSTPRGTPAPTKDPLEKALEKGP